MLCSGSYLPSDYYTMLPPDCQAGGKVLTIMIMYIMFIDSSPFSWYDSPTLRRRVETAPTNYPSLRDKALMRSINGPIQTTRQSVLYELWKQRETTVDDLAQKLALSPMTIRHHLAILERDGLVQAVSSPRSGSAGRPPLLYHVTPAAADLFPSNLGRLAEALLAESLALVSSAQMQPLISRLAEHLAEGFEPIERGAPHTAGEFRPSRARRLDRIVSFLNNMGYGASWTPDDPTEKSYSIRLTNCPYGWLARQHREICQIDRALLAKITAMLVEGVPEEDSGSDAEPRPGCVYRLIPAGESEVGSAPETGHGIGAYEVPEAA
jgi:predicted ArsR family transcriptional regulator